jgi:ubiquitin-protein ligase
MAICAICGQSLDISVDHTREVYICPNIKCQIDYEHVICDNVLINAYHSREFSHFPFLLELSRIAAHEGVKHYLSPFPNAFLPPNRQVYDRKMFNADSGITGTDYTRLLSIGLTADNDNLICTTIETIAEASNGTDQKVYDIIGDLYLWARFVFVTNKIKMYKTTLKAHDVKDTSKQTTFVEYDVIHPETVRQDFMRGETYFHLLFHGSNIANWHSILRHGIKNLSDTKHCIHGAAYGRGIYLGSLITASGYSVGDTIVVAAFEIRGKQEKYNKGGGWCSVVTDDNDLLLLYLVACDVKRTNFDIIENALTHRYKTENVLRHTDMCRLTLVQKRRLMRELPPLHDLTRVHPSGSSYTVQVNTETNSLTVTLLNTVKEMYAQFVIDYSPFPSGPPFVYMIGPRLKNERISERGAICLDILAPANWLLAIKLDSLIETICYIINEYTTDKLPGAYPSAIQAKKDLYDIISINNWEFSQ